MGPPNIVEGFPWGCRYSFSHKKLPRQKAKDSNAYSRQGDVSKTWNLVGTVYWSQGWSQKWGQEVWGGDESYLVYLTCCVFVYFHVHKDRIQIVFYATTCLWPWTLSSLATGLTLVPLPCLAAYLFTASPSSVNPLAFALQIWSCSWNMWLVPSEPIPSTLFSYLYSGIATGLLVVYQ